MTCWRLYLLKAAFLISKYKKKSGPGNTGWFGMFCKVLRKDKKKKVITCFSFYIFRTWISQLCIKAKQVKIREFWTYVLSLLYFFVKASRQMVWKAFILVSLLTELNLIIQDLELGASIKTLSERFFHSKHQEKFFNWQHQKLVSCQDYISLHLITRNKRLICSHSEHESFQ